MKKEQIYQIIKTALMAALTCVAIALGLQSCTLSRTMTTTSQCIQRGDTSIVIQTKTVEMYDAQKRGL